VKLRLTHAQVTAGIKCDIEDFNASYVSFCGLKCVNGANFGHGWNGTEFAGVIEFNGAEISGDVDFRNAEFTQHASFKGAKFEDIADFRDVEFCGTVDFSGSEFEKKATFKSAEFDGGGSIRIRFRLLKR
jgi:uncharacterized protein YjbI with pentapeptide repeats